MYRTARPGLERLTGRPAETLDGYFAELEPVHAELFRELGETPAAGALMQSPLLYVLVRALRPQHLVETGVSSGFSARLMLEALERNGSGHLESIGLAEFAVTPGATEMRAALVDRSIGWLVPDRLQHRWTLRVGSSAEILPEIAQATGRPIDFFLHDSQHRYPTMAREYRDAWAGLVPGGWLASHDIHASAAWADFVRSHGLSGDEELDHDLGVVRVPGTVG